MNVIGLKIFIATIGCISAFSMASSGRDFDPRTRAFSDEELKPQPMIKKSRKQVNDVSALIIPSGMLLLPAGSGDTHTLTQLFSIFEQ